MKAYKLILLSAIIITYFLTGCSKNPSVSEAWSTAADLKVPESVMYDNTRDILYVSNINGKPTLKNGEGFIAKVKLDGTIAKLKWVTGMNAPKGMGIRDGILYVTDIDRFHLVDIAEGKIKKTHTVAGAEFLNDVAIDKKGNVYITDMATRKVHVLKGGAITLWLDLKSFHKPNGLLMEGNDLMIGTGNGLLRVNIESKKKTMEIPHLGGIDGLKSDGKGGYIISDWAGKTQLISRGKEAVVLLDTTEKKINSADLEYIPEMKLVLIPTFFDNRVVAYRLKN